MDEAVFEVYMSMLIHRDHLISCYEMEPNTYRLVFEYPVITDGSMWYEDDNYDEYNITLRPRNEP